MYQKSQEASATQRSSKEKEAATWRDLSWLTLAYPKTAPEESGSRRIEALLAAFLPVFVSERI